MMSEAERAASGIADFDVPAGAIDPVTSTDGEIQQHGLPARPDRATMSDLYDLWENLVVRCPTYVRPELDDAPGYESNFLRGDPAPAITRQQASRNWSGAYITPRDGRMFTTVIGAWSVPHVIPPIAVDDDYQSSTWIGLDGQRQYLDSTLPQIGTAQRVLVVGGVPTFFTSSWVQWWPTIPPKTILPINQGDDVVGWLTVLSYDWMYFALFNLNAGTYSPFLWHAPMVPWPTVPWPTPPGLLQSHISGATAEWVMERPMVWGSDVLYELPDYFPVAPPTMPRAPVMFGCLAVSAVAPGAPGRIERLVGPRRIRMYRVDGTAHRTQVVSVGARPDTPSLITVTTTYIPR